MAQDSSRHDSSETWLKSILTQGDMTRNKGKFNDKNLHIDLEQAKEELARAREAGKPLVIKTSCLPVLTFLS